MLLLAGLDSFGIFVAWVVFENNPYDTPIISVALGFSIALGGKSRAYLFGRRYL